MVPWQKVRQIGVRQLHVSGLPVHPNVIVLLQLQPWIGQVIGKVEDVVLEGICTQWLRNKKSLN